MISGNWTATAVSVELVAASLYRDSLTIQLQNATPVYVGFGAAASATESLTLLAAGDSVTVRGALSREAIYILGNGAQGVYQEGDLTLNV